MIHPTNHFERLQIKQKKDAKRQRQEEIKAGRARRAAIEREKAQETEHELKAVIKGEVD